MLEVANGKAFKNRILANEFCFLQLRLICECIALSCLIAHGHRNEVSSLKFQKDFAADSLMRKLERLHPEFYPIPVKIEFLIQGGMNLMPRECDHLKKLDLIRLVQFTGSKLHRGPIKDYTFKPTDNQLAEDFQKIITWGNQILLLLDQHRINLSSGNEYLICYLKDEKDNVGVFFAGPGNAG
jgi:hypothetical protein